MNESRLGLVQVYTGNGKGKTTASLGQALRAIGHGYSVVMIQFMKGGKHIGELHASKKIPKLRIKQFGKMCPYSEKMREGAVDCGNCGECFLPIKEDKKKAREALAYAEKAARSGRYDMVILDEINVALARKLVPVGRVLKLMESKSPKTELILTGRNAPKKIIDEADLVTEMVEIKHPRKKGFNERLGIEY